MKSMSEDDIVEELPMLRTRRGFGRESSWLPPAARHSPGRLSPRVRGGVDA